MQVSAGREYFRATRTNAEIDFVWTEYSERSLCQDFISWSVYMILNQLIGSDSPFFFLSHQKPNWVTLGSNVMCQFVECRVESVSVVGPPLTLSIIMQEFRVIQNKLLPSVQTAWSECASCQYVSVDPQWLSLWPVVSMLECWLTAAKSMASCQCWPTAAQSVASCQYVSVDPQRLSLWPVVSMLDSVLMHSY